LKRGRATGDASNSAGNATHTAARASAAAPGPLCQNLLPRRSLWAGPAENPMSTELIKHVTDESFSTDVLQSDKPVLVDYWAEWCGPCKMIAPILDEVSKTYDGRLQVAKLNVDDNREVPARFGIRGIPTLMLFKDGQVAATKVGALSKAQLTAFLDGHL
jgi:thioredoxin 1